MGVCCIVFDIDGMLFEFFMNFLNIDKNKIWCTKKKSGGGGGGGVLNFFLKILSHFTFYAIQNIKKILKTAPSLTG